jgi:23S rRNA A1618 N6-methylase RlmF
MCNPPFYEDADELYRHAKMKALEPFSVCAYGILVNRKRLAPDPQVRCVRPAEK